MLICNCGVLSRVDFLDIFYTKTFNANDLCEKINVAGVSTEEAGMFSNCYGVMAVVNLAIER